MTKVFESPDGGKTVYARDPGSIERQLVAMNDKERKFREKVRENTLWEDIREAARTDKTLQDALDRVKILYYMKQDHGNKNSKT